MDVIPAILTNNLAEFNSQLLKLSFADVIQIDFMDGSFVETKSIDIKDVPALKGYFEAHLMIKDPIKNLELLKQKGFKRVIIHLESTNKINDAISHAKELDLEICLAFNPKTKPKIIEEVKRYLFLTVKPGRQDQSFINEAASNAMVFKKTNPDLIVGVDGGVNKDNIILLKELDFVCVGSFITKSKDYLESYKKLVRNVSGEKS